jgi:hypothetical protein
MKKRCVIAAAAVLVCGLAFGERAQRVWVEAAESGGLVAVDVLYAAEEARLAGLGLRLHYSSEELEFVGLENVLNDGLIGAMEPQRDLDNFDGDPRTDAYLLLAWADLDAAWPGVNRARLYRALFRPLTDGPALVGFSASSTAAGHQLAAEAVELEVRAPIRERRPLPVRGRW